MNKDFIVAQRKILNALKCVPNRQIRALSEELNINLELTTYSCDKLFEFKLIKTGVGNTPSHDNLPMNLTDKCEDYLEHVSNEDIHNEALTICTEIRDFTWNTYNKVFDMIQFKKISELVNGVNPLYGMATSLEGINFNQSMRCSYQ